MLSKKNAAATAIDISALICLLFQYMLHLMLLFFLRIYLYEQICVERKRVNQTAIDFFFSSKLYGFFKHIVEENRKAI